MTLIELSNLQSPNAYDWDTLGYSENNTAEALFKVRSRYTQRWHDILKRMVNASEEVRDSFIQLD